MKFLNFWRKYREIECIICTNIYLSFKEESIIIKIKNEILHLKDVVDTLYTEKDTTWNIKSIFE